MTLFEVGKTYRDVDAETWPTAYTVVKRTAKTVTVTPSDDWISDHNRNPRSFRVKLLDNAETFKPLGNYSGSPVIEATYVMQDHQVATGTDAPLSQPADSLDNSAITKSSSEATKPHAAILFEAGKTYVHVSHPYGKECHIAYTTRYSIVKRNAKTLIVSNKRGETSRRLIHTTPDGVEFITPDGTGYAKHPVLYATDTDDSHAETAQRAEKPRSTITGIRIVNWANVKGQPENNAVHDSTAPQIATVPVKPKNGYYIITANSDDNAPAPENVPHFEIGKSYFVKAYSCAKILCGIKEYKITGHSGLFFTYEVKSYELHSNGWTHAYGGRAKRKLKHEADGGEYITISSTYGGYLFPRDVIDDEIRSIINNAKEYTGPKCFNQHAFMQDYPDCPDESFSDFAGDNSVPTQDIPPDHIPDVAPALETHDVITPEIIMPDEPSFCPTIPANQTALVPCAVRLSAADFIRIIALYLRLYFAPLLWMRQLLHQPKTIPASVSPTITRFVVNGFYQVNIDIGINHWMRVIARSNSHVIFEDFMTGRQFSFPIMLRHTDGNKAYERCEQPNGLHATDASLFRGKPAREHPNNVIFKQGLSYSTVKPSHGNSKTKNRKMRIIQRLRIRNGGKSTVLLHIKVSGDGINAPHGYTEGVVTAWVENGVETYDYGGFFLADSPDELTLLDTKGLSHNALHEATCYNADATLHAPDRETLTQKLATLSAGAIKRIGKCLGLIASNEKGNSQSLADSLSDRLFAHMTQANSKKPQTYTDHKGQICIIFD